MDKLATDATTALNMGMTYGKYMAQKKTETIIIPDPPKKVKMRSCIRCGALFPIGDRGAGVHKKFCSDECREKSYDERKAQLRTKHKTCPVCGKTFVTENNHKKYCGIDCYRLSAADRARQYNRRRKEMMRNGNNQVL